MKTKRMRILNGAIPTGKSETKPWNIVSLSDDEGEITLYGEVCAEHPVDWWTGEKAEGLYITPEGFMEDLETVKNKKKITVKLNSVGGDLYTGIAIHNAIKALKSEVTVIVEGIAASAASVIMCAGDTVKVYPGSMVMIHEPSCVLFDNVTIDSLKNVEKMLQAGTDAIVAIYKEKTGLKEDKIRDLVHATTWFTGEEAVANKFADELLTGELDLAASLSSDNVLMVAGVSHALPKDWKIPNKFKITRNSTVVMQTKTAEAPEDKSGKAGNTPNGGQKMSNGEQFKTVDELVEACPELVKQVKDQAAKDAIEAERKRLQEIEDIATTVGDDAMVNDAKYVNPINAAQLALKAMQAQKALGTKVLKDLKDDALKSGAAGVQADGSGDNHEDDKPLTPADKIAAGREAAKKAQEAK